VSRSNRSASACGPETATTTVKQAIADKIIGLAKSGERNPDLLAERALKDIRQPQIHADK
jgi:hypothetical protein